MNDSENKKDKIKALNDEQSKKDLPDFKPGDRIKVYSKIKEGSKERVQVFQGDVIACKNGSGPSATFTVRKVSYNIGVEKTFLLHSPRIEKIEIVSRGNVRRSKLYYLRERSGKSARIRTRFQEGNQKGGEAENTQPENQNGENEKFSADAEATPASSPA